MQTNKTQPLPNNKDIEMAIVGAMLVDSNAFFAINELQKLSIDDFYNSNISIIFGIARELAESNKKIDLLTVGEKIRAIYQDESKRCDLIECMLDCANRVGSSAHLDTHVLMLKEDSMRRKMIYKAYESINRCYDKSCDIFEIVQGHQKEVLQITDSLSSPPADMLQLFDTLDGLVMGEVQTGNVVCKTGLEAIDKIINGVEKDDILTVAGVSGSGKTAFICGLVERFINVGLPVIIYSYEMTAVKLLMRIVCACCEISYDNLKNGKLDESEVQQYFAIKAKIVDSGLLQIYDCAGVSIQGLMARSVAAKMKFGQIGCIMIDYLQLIQSDVRANDENAITKDVMRNILAMMKRCECPIIPLSQITKSVGTARPQIFNLYGAQIIEATSTKVLIVHRPEKFGIAQFDDGTSSLGMAEVLIAKNREGVAGDAVKLAYKGSFYKFDNDSPF